ncbi:MAG TPA: membrane protein insertion efficiency factor YidD [Alphaproteobacteria bacterium]|nr:membrane protein insertion efficiency factor YidD [Alphaproteobacteria bacterium]
MKKNISILSKISLILIRVYQKSFSALIGRSCRFAPTCSDYALIAIKRYGFFKGWYLALIRIAKCNPWGPHGHDPVPKNKKHKEN